MTKREEALARAAQEFIDKCDRGKARSVQSYKAFKEALAMEEQLSSVCQECGKYAG